MDVAHEKLLSAWPYRQSAIETLKALVDHPPFRVAMGDFLVYSMFRDVGNNQGRLKNLEAIEQNVKGFDVEFDDYFAIENGCLRHDPASIVPNHVTEAIGVAIGLLVVSKLHGLILADWTKIPKLSYKHLDFELASDSQQVIQVETKGTITVNNLLKSGEGAGSVANHKAGITHKKIEVRNRILVEEDDFPALIRYGTIASVDSSRGVRCWVLDPPAVDFPGAARALRIVKRMHFLGRVISLIAPYSELAKKLNRRVREMTLENAESFNNKRLDVDQTGAERFYSRNGQTLSRSFYGGRGRKASTSNVGGVVVRQPGRYRGIFVGIEDALLELAISQDQDALLSYRAEVRSTLNETIRWGPQRKRRRFHANVHHSTSGLVVGIGRPSGDEQETSDDEENIDDQF